MKIAICFSGAIRSFLTCYPSIYQNIIQPLNADIFFHMWSFGEDINKHKDNSEYLSHFKLQNDECNMKYVIDKTNPIQYVIENYNNEWEKKIINECNGTDIIESMSQRDKNYAISAMSMYFKIFMCNKLKK